MMISVELKRGNFEASMLLDFAQDLSTSGPGWCDQDSGHNFTDSISALTTHNISSEYND